MMTTPAARRDSYRASIEAGRLSPSLQDGELAVRRLQEIMYLSGVACVVPAAKVVNAEILELVAHHSRGVFAGNLRALLSGIDLKLRRTGIVTRHWRSPKQRPITLLQEACELALQESGIAPADVDFVIYAGVDRGFAEPANACFVAKALGMHRARTFDVADACLGWSTATEIAQGLFAMSGGEVALIVTAEFPMRSNGSVLPECFTIASTAELEWKFPAFTLGEAATASIVIGGGPRWKYVHESHNQLADLCTVSLGPPSDYACASHRFGSDEATAFRAYGSELAVQAYRPAVRVLRAALGDGETRRIVFPHSVIGPYIDAVAARVSNNVRIFSTFSELGNIATSSLPSCIARARQRAVITSADRPIGWVAASGLKVSSFEIVQAVL
jgi:3-oxoacyl-[acyl-carrier-protein] synthase III